MDADKMISQVQFREGSGEWEAVAIKHTQDWLGEKGRESGCRLFVKMKRLFLHVHN